MNSFLQDLHTLKIFGWFHSGMEILKELYEQESKYLAQIDAAKQQLETVRAAIKLVEDEKRNSREAGSTITRNRSEKTSARCWDKSQEWEIRKTII